MRNHDKDVMVDIETLASQSNAAIIQIGACTFDEKETFLVNVPEEWYDADQAGEMNYHVSPSTVKWWEEQGEEARASLRMDPMMSLPVALRSFTGWLSSIGFRSSYSGAPGIWANPPQFDLTILRHAYMTELGGRVPWHYRQERCIRTIWREFKRYSSATSNAGLVAHRADHDAIRQARGAVAILKKLSPDE